MRPSRALTYARSAAALAAHKSTAEADLATKTAARIKELDAEEARLRKELEKHQHNRESALGALRASAAHALQAAEAETELLRPGNFSTRKFRARVTPSGGLVIDDGTDGEPAFVLEKPEETEGLREWMNRVFGPPAE